MNGSVLEMVVGSARRSAEQRERGMAPEDVAREVEAARPRGAAFRDALKGPGLNLIAECKRRSPSRGVLRRDYDPAAIATSYQAAGAAAISVLTEPTFFDGSLDHLSSVRQAVDVPVLRKDFVVTEFQLAEACAAGADAVLLIVAALEESDLARLQAYATSLGLAALVEVHSPSEVDVALSVGATIVGVNSRDLRSMEVRPETFTELAPLLPAAVVAVAESGLRSGGEVARLRDQRYDAFLIGERFMTDPDPGAALFALRRDIGEDTV